MSRANYFGRSTASAALMLLMQIVAPSVYAQVNVARGPLSLTTEGYANATVGFPLEQSQAAAIDSSDLRVDAALRMLLRWTNPSGPDIGVRAVIEASPENTLDLAEASLLIFGRGGRVEIGERQGLPDVLLGYAPNNFTFTGAEFGPASGPSLDPGGGLQEAFLGATLRPRLRDLSVLGFAASLSGDRSAKVLYVSPKARGWLAGVSYASDAADPRFRDLVQTGITHDTYWKENVLHVGGSYSFARADAGGAPVTAAGDAVRRDLHSVNLGATLVLNYDWMLGASVTYDGTSGLTRLTSVRDPRGDARGDSQSDAWGAVVSLNYNRGPWTAGAFIQRATREGDTARRGDDVERGGAYALTAFEAGLSYRVSTKLRLYAAWYAFDLDNEGGTRVDDRFHGQLLLVGARATL